MKDHFGGCNIATTVTMPWSGPQPPQPPQFDILILVRMIWWFLIVAVAGGAVLWAALSAYVRVRQGLSRAENRPPEPDQPDAGREL